VEALAMGLFVISSRYNGGREVLNEESGAIIENLTDPMSMVEALTKALSRPKDPVRALQIRNSVKHLDFSNQLDKIVQLTLK
jgi:UDP-glucose:(heptosyl)LPS alpha-1,3-glucosyltransferase